MVVFISVIHLFINFYFVKDVGIFLFFFTFFLFSETSNSNFLLVNSEQDHLCYTNTHILKT